MEAKIIACLDKEEFASYLISWLLEFYFRKKPWLRLFHLTYLSNPRPIATPLILAAISLVSLVFVSILSTYALSTSILINTFIYPK